MLTDTNEIILHIADLIEKGSQGHTQRKGSYFNRHETNDDFSVCAIGACFLAAGYTRDDVYCSEHFNVSEALNIWSWPQVTYPDLQINPLPLAENEGKAPLMDVIIWLNDQCGWEFSRIVAYLRSLVPDSPSTPPKTRKKRSAKVA